MKSIYPVAMLLFLLCCKNPREEKVETTPVSKYAEIIRNPLSATGTVDSSDAAQIRFEHEIFHFDTVREGTVVKHTFKFTNTGKKPLIISDARSTCGCTVSEYSKEIIDPGESGHIIARFNTSGKTLTQDKAISVYANTIPPKTIVRLRGYVIPNPKQK